MVGVRSVLIDRGTERSKGAMRSRHEYLGPFLQNLLCSMQLGNLLQAGRVLSPEVLMEKRFRPEGSAGLGFLSSAGSQVAGEVTTPPEKGKDLRMCLKLRNLK